MTDVRPAPPLPNRASMSMPTGVPPGTPPGTPPEKPRVAPPVTPPSAPARPAATRAGMSPADRSSTGLHVRTAAALCYAAAWIGGLIFLAFERQSRFVRFHAWQSVLAIGGLCLTGAVLWIVGMLMVFVSTGAFRVFVCLAQIAWGLMFAAALGMTVAAFTGRRPTLPVVGTLAEAWSKPRG